MNEYHITFIENFVKKCKIIKAHSMQKAIDKFMCKFPDLPITDVI